MERFTRTVAGAVLGAVVALVSWGMLYLLALFGEAASWKSVLTYSGILLPLLCIVAGVVTSYPFDSRLNFLVANLGFAILATFLTLAATITIFPASAWLRVIFAVPVFFGWLFIEERFISGLVNSCVERIAGPPP